MSDDNDQGTTPPTVKEDSKATGDPVKTLTQAEIDALIGQAKGAAKTAAKREVSEELGMSVSDAKKLLEAAAEAKRASMDEAERAKAEAAELAAKAEAQLAEARRATTEANVRSALLSGETPIRADRLDLAVTLALPVASSDAHEDPITAAVAFVAESSPEWFGTSNTDESLDTANNGSNSKTPPPPSRTAGERDKRPADAASRAREMFERNKAPGRSPMSSSPT